MFEATQLSQMLYLSLNLSPKKREVRFIFLRLFHLVNNLTIYALIMKHCLNLDIGKG